MHELSLAQDIVDIAERYAHSEGCTRIVKVFLKVGVLGHVDPGALAFGFEAVSAGTLAAGAQLIIETGEARALCVPCGLNIPLRSRNDVCPHCGRHEWLLTEGEELRVTELEVE